MAPSFGVRLKKCGPNRVAIMAKARAWLRLSPAEVKARLDAGPALIAEDVPLHTALRIESEWKGLGADVEVYVSTPCPCCGRSDHT
jgi:ribosomal protein L7/L12